MSIWSYQIYAFNVIEGSRHEHGLPMIDPWFYVWLNTVAKHRLQMPMKLTKITILSLNAYHISVFQFGPLISMSISILYLSVKVIHCHFNLPLVLAFVIIHYEDRKQLLPIFRLTQYK